MRRGRGELRGTGTDVRCDEGAERGACLTQFGGERLEEGLFRDFVPGDMEAGAARLIAVNGYDCLSVVLQRRVSISESSEDLPGFLAHGAGVAAHVQAVFDGAADIVGVGEEIETAAFADGDLGCKRGAILAGLGID